MIGSEATEAIARKALEDTALAIGEIPLSYAGIGGDLAERSEPVKESRAPEQVVRIRAGQAGKPRCAAFRRGARHRRSASMAGGLRRGVLRRNTRKASPGPRSSCS